MKELSDVYLLFISKICKYSSTLSVFLPNDFLSVSWKVVFSYFKEKRLQKLTSFEDSESEKVEVSKPSFSSMDKFCGLCSYYMNKISAKKDYLSPFTLNEFEEESLKELSTIVPSAELAEIFQTVMDDMVLCFIFFFKLSYILLENF